MPRSPCQLFEMVLFAERWLTNALQEEVDVENHDGDNGEEVSGR